MTLQDWEDDMMVVDEDEALAVTIPAAILRKKLLSIVQYSPAALVEEVRRLSSLSAQSLQRELLPRDTPVIHRLPHELLADIFTIAHNDDGITDEDGPQKLHTKLAGVCRMWRDIIHGTPTLWSRVAVRYDRPPFNATRVWLERSAQCPLRVIIYWTSEWDNEAFFRGEGEPKRLKTWSVADISALLDLLLPHAERWEALSLSVDDYVLMHHALGRLESIRAPLLDSLALFHYESTETGESFEPPELADFFDIFNAGDNAPLLSNIKLWGVHVKWDSSIFRDLTLLELSYHALDVRPSPFDFFLCLTSSSARLERLGLECSGPLPMPDDSEDWPTTPITFQKLQGLKLAFLSPEYIKLILKLTDAPLMSELTLDLDAEDDASEWNTVVETLCTYGVIAGKPRSGPMFPKLSILRIFSFPADTTYLAIFLYLHPRVIEIALNFHYLDPQLHLTLCTAVQRLPPLESVRLPNWAPRELERLVGSAIDVQDDRKIPGGPVWLLPNLKTFRGYGLSGEMLKMLVVSRKDSAPLREIYYSDGSAIKMSERNWLSANLDRFEEFEDTDNEDASDETDEEEDD